MVFYFTKLTSMRWTELLLIPQFINTDVFLTSKLLNQSPCEVWTCNLSLYHMQWQNGKNFSTFCEWNGYWAM